MSYGAGYSDGYLDGQYDVLLQLESPEPLHGEWICRDLEANFALWCLVTNLAIAGALCRAFELGWGAGFVERNGGARLWQPNINGWSCP